MEVTPQIFYYQGHTHVRSEDGSTWCLSPEWLGDPMDIENVKDVIESVKKKIKSQYRVTPHEGGIVDDLCDTVIEYLERTDRIWKKGAHPSQKFSFPQEDDE